ncbi:hypothetical protein CTI12_AA227320 [Artemisia annua]|uniref:DUF4283 domain-containing protein n=1 Tax=Artemisia annua TaxID=35608 RepID=A0A2U1NN27_ARTAN|nr:hypothetical protein CTI12_AA227320 [Artemisia annua]
MSNPINPNLVRPPVESNAVIRPKRSVRIFSDEGRNSSKQYKVVSKSSHASFKKGGQKLGGKGGGSSKIKEGMVFDDDDGGSERAADSQSLDSRSCGEAISEDFDPMPVPFDDNPVLNPSVSLISLKRGEVMIDGGNKTSASFSFNVVEKWPSLGSMSNANGLYMNGERVNDVVVPNDVVMKEANQTAKPLSFINAMQGINHSGNYRLKAYGRASFARVLVEIDATKGIVDSIEVCYKSLGRSMELRVEYDWKPDVCSQCKVFGHGYDKCTSRVLTTAEKAQRAKVNVQKYTNLGNSNNNGRGGMYSRGLGNQRVNKNEEVQYAPVKKASEFKNDKAKEICQSNKGKAEIEKNMEWEAMRNIIDEACDKGLFVSMEEKNSWFDDLKDYYKKKIEKFVKKGSINMLNLKIKNYDQKSIKSRNESVVMASKRKADKDDKSTMLEQGMTENEA